MSKQRSILKPQYKIFNPKNEREVGLFLLEMYPNGRVSTSEFHSTVLNNHASAVAKIKSDIGTDLDFYDVGVLASYIWFNGNYNAAERSFNSEYD